MRRCGPRERRGLPMPYSLKFLINAVLGAMAVAGGLWLLAGGLSVVVMAAAVVGLTVVFAKMCSGAAHVWMWATVLLGLESLAWPVPLVIELRSLGAEPPLDAMREVFTAVLFGGLSGIFWLTFAYGLYRRIHPDRVAAPLTPNQAKAKRRKQS